MNFPEKPNKLILCLIEVTQTLDQKHRVTAKSWKLACQLHDKFNTESNDEILPFALKMNIDVNIAVKCNSIFNRYFPW